METSILRQTLESSIRAVQQLPSHSPEAVEETVKRLEEFGYSPILIIPVDGFIRRTKEEIIDEMNQIVGLDDPAMRELGFTDGADLNTKKDQQLNLMVHHFSLLSRLRSDEPEAWDEVSELYEDD